MPDLDPTPHSSPLTQSVTRDGKSVQIDIYRDGEGGWILEVVDEYGNSTVWDDSFATDQDALDEALKTIAEDGIDSLIGTSSEGHGMQELDQPLSADELDALDDFLANESIEDTSMDVSTLEGFLTAIAIGPRTVMPSEWLPWVWDMEDGESEAGFESVEQANRIISLVMRYYNAVVHAFMDDPASFEPVFWSGTNGAPPNGARVSCSASSSATRRGACWPLASPHGLRPSCVWAPTMGSISPSARAMRRNG